MVKPHSPRLAVLPSHNGTSWFDCPFTPMPRLQTTTHAPPLHRTLEGLALACRESAVERMGCQPHRFASHPLLPRALIHTEPLGSASHSVVAFAV